jgi:hypothetical protein
MIKPHFLKNILDINTSKIIFEPNNVCKYNVSTQLTDMREILFVTPYLLIDNEYIVQCFYKGLIPIEILSHSQSITNENRILLDGFVQRMKEIEEIISADNFKLKNFGTTNMVLKQHRLHPFGFGTYLFSIPVTESSDFVMKEEIHFRKDVLEKFLCPITGTIPNEPVLFDNHIYNRDSILKWLSISYNSPLTRRSHDENGKLLEIMELSFEKLEEFKSYRKETDFELDDEIIIRNTILKKPDCDYKITLLYEEKNGIRTRINTDDKKPEDYLQTKMKIKIGFNISIDRVGNEYYINLIFRSLHVNKDI